MPEMKYLEAVLQRGFIPRYFLEDLRIFKSAHFKSRMRYNLAIPMVCFCDIPLSKIKDHLGWYGGYGIGIDKKWGRDNGITPVNYFDPLSESVRNLGGALESANRTLASLKKEMVASGSIADHILDAYNQTDLNISRLLRTCFYFKPYEGPFQHNSDFHPNKRFYDEREWRFVPNTTLFPGYKQFLVHGKDFKTSIEKEVFNQQIESNTQLHLPSTNLPLPLNPEIIKYIIVNERADPSDRYAEITQLMAHLDAIYPSPTYSKASVDLLKTKIITTRQIQEDF